MDISVAVGGEVECMKKGVNGSLKDVSEWVGRCLI